VEGWKSSQWLRTRPIRSGNSGCSLHALCASKLSHGAKLMKWLGLSRSRTRRNVPEPGRLLAHVANAVQSWTNASSSPGFTNQEPLVYVSAMVGESNRGLRPGKGLYVALSAGA